MKQKAHSDRFHDLKAKVKDKDWYIRYMEQVVPYTDRAVPDYDRIIRNAQIYNGDLTSVKAEMEKFCNPTGIDLVAEDVKPYPKLHTSIGVLKGEKLKRNENFKILILSARAIKDENEQLLAALEASVDEEIALEIEKQRVKFEGMDPSEIEEYIEGLRTQEMPEDIMEKNFLSEWEIFYSKALKFGYNDQDIKTLEMLTFEDALVQDKFFVHTGFEFGKPSIKIRNVASTNYKKSPDEFRIHKGEYISYTDAITPTDAFALYKDELSDEDLKSIINKSNYSIRDKRNSILDGKARNIHDTTDDALIMAFGNEVSTGDKSVGMHQSDNYGTDDLIWRTHFEFKAYDRIIYLTYTDPMGESITTIVKDDYKIPEKAEKIKFTNKFGMKSVKFVWMDDDQEFIAEPMYIPRKYEVTRLDGEIYVQYRAVPFQVTNLENPFSTFELSTKGAILTSRNAASISLFERALPLYMQYLYIKHIQNRELSKYQGYIQDIDVDQIPESLGMDIDGNLINDPIEVSLMYQRTLGRNFYSGSQSAVSGMANPQQSPGSQSHIFSTANEIYNLQNLLELIEREMLMALGIAPQRIAEFSSNTNVGDNQQSIAQSHHITEPYFYMHSIVWKDILKGYLQNFRTYAERILLGDKDEHTLSYILPDGTKELFKITRKSVELLDIALYVTNTGQEQEYLNMMKQLTQPLTQNQGQGITVISALVKSITSGASPEEVHKMIKIEERKQEERMAQEQEASLKAQQATIQMQNEAQERQYAHEIEKITLENESREKIAAMNNTARAEEKDADGDGTPDYMEILKLGQDAEIKARELDLKNKEIEEKQKDRDHQASENEKDRKLKEKEMRAKPAPTAK